MSVKNLNSATYCMMHPARIMIIQLLRERPSTFTEISKETGLSRQLVAYHMSFLETFNLLESEYIFTEREGKRCASRQYRCSVVVEKVIKWAIEKLSRLQD